MGMSAQVNLSAPVQASLLVQAQVYPLGQGDLLPAIKAVWKAFDAYKLNYQPGAMSTLLQGDIETVFAALRDAFQAAAEFGATVMVVTVSNACTPLSLQEAVAHHA
jgi:uncharacterized protein YqgV (UPF0045/DUF77 family)